MRAIDAVLYAVLVLLALHGLVKAAGWSLDLAHAYDLGDLYQRLVLGVVAVLVLAIFIYAFAHDLPRGWRP